MSGIPVQQSGTVTPGHATQWTTDGVVQDAGPATAGGLSELGITKEGGIALGVNNTSTFNNAPYVQWGVGVSDTGIITIYANSYGGAPAATLEYNINGVTYAFNPVGGGNITGPSVAVSGDLVSFNGTSGQLVRDSGISGASVVSGPASAVSGHLATFNGTTGKIIEDGGSLTTAVDTILASPPAIGGTAAAAGSFTTLSATTTLAVTGDASAAALTLSGSEAITNAPTGNATISTQSSFVLQGTTQYANIREFLVSLGLTANTGSGATANNQDKVTLYSGMVANAGCGDVWSLNTVCTMSASSGTYNAQGYELDFNNLDADRGDGLLGAGLAAPVAYGLSITGAGTFLSTSALLISGPGTAIWNRGLTIANGSVAQASFQDLGNATKSIEIAGFHTYAIDLEAAACTNGYQIRLANGGYLVARNPGNTADVPLLGLDSSNNLILGSSSESGVINAGTLIPLTDNAYSVGASGIRWTSIWAVNGTIQTSDPSLKTNIAAVDGNVATRLVAAISPITFSWKVGGKTLTGGKWVDQPGKRTHWGFDASQIGATFGAEKLDFGGYIKGEDGTLALRPDQLIPVLWRAVQALTERVGALEARVS